MTELLIFYFVGLVATAIIVWVLAELSTLVGLSNLRLKHYVMIAVCAVLWPIYWPYMALCRVYRKLRGR